MIDIIILDLSVLEEDERINRKCGDCVYCNKKGFVENCCHIDVCKLIMEKEKSKKQKGLKYDLCKALILDNCLAENCCYFKRKD